MYLVFEIYFWLIWASKENFADGEILSNVINSFCGFFYIFLFIHHDKTMLREHNRIFFYCRIHSNYEVFQQYRLLKDKLRYHSNLCVYINKTKQNKH